jgi:two-component system nitrogen regulation sensor histidine kinase NtrY
MKQRLIYSLAIVLLVLSVLLVVWQGSFHLFGPANPQQTLIFWMMSSLIFILMVTLGWILFREGVKLYISRQGNRPGSRIGTKLVVGALTLSCLPVSVFLLWSYEVLNYNLKIWFSNPVENQIKLYADISDSLAKEMQSRLNSQAALLALQPEARQLLTLGARTPDFLEQFSNKQGIDGAAILSLEGGAPLDAFGAYPARPGDNPYTARAAVTDGTRTIGSVLIWDRPPVDSVRQQAKIEKYSQQWGELQKDRRDFRTFYLMLMALLTLFMMFVTTWIALLLAKQISVPITALLEAADEVRKGNLKHRVDVRAIDELAWLVRGFNRMTQELDSSTQELDRRRRFTEAILESIPTGVISIGPDGSIQRVNQALGKIFSAGQVARATRLEDLLSREDTAEIKYLMKRARRTGAASRQFDLRTENRTLHLAVTVSALEEKLTSGYVVVLEDTSELLRAQKAAAWHEVARRVAHEIKNPLTPIGLSAERIARQLERVDLPPATARILRECAACIAKSVESVKMLVDEFATFARFPAAQPVRSDLNEVVKEALGVFHGRLEGIFIRTTFAVGLPAVNLDREQFQRVVVNLVDNAAEAMQDSLVKELYIATQPGVAETLELVIADSGPGVSPEDREKLFLPYFSTKNRGTGLGLAIVNHILAEHSAQIRVEDNRPVGTRFTVEIPVPAESEPAENGAKTVSAKA